MSRAKRRVAVSTCTAALLACWLASACSTTTPSYAGADGVSDAAPPPDEPRGSSDAGADRVPRDAASADAMRRDAGGRCTPLQGPACDLVLQDCPAVNGAEQQCVAALDEGGGMTTACVPVAGSQSVPLGNPCCARDGADPCLKGLVCVGGDACVDGGKPSGRCSPYCCGDDATCGQDTDGLPGRCRLTIVGGSPRRDLYQVCSYSPICRPLGVHACPSGSTCIVSDTSGSATCTRIFSPDGGLGLGPREPCASANACADGLQCLGTADGGTFCEYVCHVQGTATPFDAGGLSGTPGRGGCPPTTPTCVGVPNLFPIWLGICR